MSSAMALHRSVVRHRAGRIHLVQEEEPARKRPISPEEGVMRIAAPVLMLASYRNQALHVFVRPALLATSIHITKSRQRGEGLGVIFFFSRQREAFLSSWFIVTHCCVHRWALHLLLLPTGALLLWVHLHPWQVVSGNTLICRGSASSKHLGTTGIIILLNHVWNLSSALDFWYTGPGEAI